MTIEPQPAGPTFARYGGAHAGPNRTYGDIYINIYTRNLKFAQLVTELASLAITTALQLENATALGSRIPPHAVLLHVNNTPVKLKIVFAI